MAGNTKALVWSFGAALVCGVLVVGALGERPSSVLSTGLVFLLGLAIAVVIAGVFDDDRSNWAVRFSAALTGAWLPLVLAIGGDWS